jgi:ABC-type dipeptide/oligopeptide/nickel transport system permease component
VVGSSSTTGLILPALALGFSSGGLLARLVRSTMLEVTSEDYIRTAYAKGLRERVVVLRHALRNALIPVVTVSGMLFGGLLGGSVVIETVFARGGLGSLIILAINLRDIPVVVGVIMFFALIVVLTNLVVDLSYGFLDPRIRHQ